MTVTLASVPPGAEVVLEHIGDTLPASFREQLAAYGLVAGRPLTVLQQRPMTVLVCDHVELALEQAVAEALCVSAPAARK
jgi:Fe2+ transport system protein FeoA